MRAMSGSIKKHSIALKKGDTIFVDSGDNVMDDMVGVPLLYMGTHAQTGDYIVEHGGVTKYLTSPSVSAILPAEYMEAMFEVFDVAFDTGSTQPSSVDGAQQYDFGAAKAAKDNENVSFSDILRAAAKDIEDNVFGEPSDAGVLILRLPKQDNYIFRPMNMGEKEAVVAFEDCKLKALGYVHHAEIAQYND